MGSFVERWRQSARRAFTRLRGGDLTPSRLAASVALGLFIGVLPLYGTHLVLCTTLGLFLRLDVLIVYAAANISIPPMIPILLYASVQLGAWIETGRPHASSWQDWRDQSLWTTTEHLVIGSVALGLALGLVGGGLTYMIASSWRRRARARGELGQTSEGAQEAPAEKSERAREALARVRARYDAAPPQHRYYVRSKLKMDPLTGELLELAERGIARGVLVDAGAGRGQFALLLAELGVVTSIVGFDHDAQKIEAARRASSGAPVPVEFAPGDLRTAAFPPADTILLFDVLHYLSEEEQRLVLARAGAALRPGGVLLVRETNRASSAGASWARRFEVVGRALGINRGERLFFRAPDEIARDLEALGLQVRVHGGRGVLDNVLLVAEARAPDGAAPRDEELHGAASAKEGAAARTPDEPASSALGSEEPRADLGEGQSAPVVK